MKRIILCLSLFAFFGSQAQQINPVPDYVFSNKMSVGRNAVTDTAAYFSIGPRYGAIRGMMPPMVTDTASMSATKRNGLLIFSIQKNKYLYWDSVGSKWAEMAGTAGSAITGSGVAGYMPEFTTTTNLDTTRLYHSSGRFAIGSTTTTNGVFNVYGGQSYFDTSIKVGSQTLLADEGKNEVYVNTTSDAGAYPLQVAGNIYSTAGAALAATGGEVYINTTTDQGAFNLQVSGSTLSTSGYFTSGSGVLGIGVTSTTYPATINKTGPSAGIGNAVLQVRNPSSDDNQAWIGYIGSDETLFAAPRQLVFTRFHVGIGWSETMRLNNTGELLLGSSTDAGSYRLQVTGDIYGTGSITTGAPSGGSIKPWKIGEAATVSPTSPNRTIRVEIDGTVYYIHAKTTND